jgi:hypothetical protein
VVVRPTPLDVTLHKKKNENEEFLGPAKAPLAWNGTIEEDRLHDARPKVVASS